MTRNPLTYGTDGNRYALDCYLDEQDQCPICDALDCGCWEFAYDDECERGEYRRGLSEDALTTHFFGDYDQ